MSEFNALQISQDNGETSYDYEFTYSIDGDIWHTVLFESLYDARNYALQVVNENKNNIRLSYYFRRMVQVLSSDFFDEEKTGSELHVISKHATYDNCVVETL